ncbi:MAG: hypothetical protein ACLUAL_07805 [Blautia wexlerae]
MEDMITSDRFKYESPTDKITKISFFLSGIFDISGIVRQFKPWYYEVKQKFFEEDFYVKIKLCD